MSDKQSSKLTPSVLQWGLGVAIATVALIPGAAIAQTATPEETVWGKETVDPFSPNNGASSLLDLMQQINRGPSQSWSDFRANQQENLDSAAAAFRDRQRLLLQPNASSIGPSANIEAIELQPADPQPDSME